MNSVFSVPARHSSFIETYLNKMSLFEDVTTVIDSFINVNKNMNKEREFRLIDLVDHVMDRVDWNKSKCQVFMAIYDYFATRLDIWVLKNKRSSTEDSPLPQIRDCISWVMLSYERISRCLDPEKQVNVSNTLCKMFTHCTIDNPCPYVIMKNTVLRLKFRIKR